MTNNTNVLTLKKLYVSALVAISLGMLGCASTGSLSDPLKPKSVVSKSDQSVAKVYFYRSHDSYGFLQTGKRVTKVNDGDIADGLHAGRDSYMIRKLKPGTHKFTMGASERIVNLEAGRSYFLAIAWNLGSMPNLEFRDEKSFKEDTQGDEQIRIVKCTIWDCEYAKVTQ
jgi:hypothetical protein